MLDVSGHFFQSSPSFIMIDLSAALLLFLALLDSIIKLQLCTVGGELLRTWWTHDTLLRLFLFLVNVKSTFTNMLSICCINGTFCNPRSWCVYKLKLHFAVFNGGNYSYVNLNLNRSQHDQALLCVHWVQHQKHNTLLMKPEKKHWGDAKPLPWTHHRPTEI